jgi:hypothetical protein
VFVPVDTPCRIVRTQGTGQTQLTDGVPRNFFSFGSAGTIGAQGGDAAGCDHPRAAEGVAPVAIAANVTAVGNQASGNGNIVAYPAGEAAPGASTVNYTTAANIANSTLIKLRTSDGSFALLSSFANVPAVVDVLGYYYPMSSAAAPAVNTNQIALLRWYEANESGIAFPVGSRPFAVAFDGVHIWVANNTAGTVSKLRASDGVELGPFLVGAGPISLAFDGAHIWVTHSGELTVSKLRASDGVVVGTFDVGTDPRAVAFDGAHIWVANFGGSTMSKL